MKEPLENRKKIVCFLFVRSRHNDRRCRPFTVTKDRNPFAVTNLAVLTPRFPARNPPCQLPVSDASVSHRFCFLFSEFCLLSPRRQKPAVGFTDARPQTQASKPGSLISAQNPNKNAMFSYRGRTIMQAQRPGLAANGG
jgi:hypothetical protein